MTNEAAVFDIWPGVAVIVRDVSLAKVGALWKLALLSAVLLVSAAGAQESADTHLSLDPAAPIFQRSVFLHGYAHGYEMGFHAGDLDLHMGRSSRDPRSIKLFKEGRKEYRNGFGNRDMFENGYGQGFRVGYADAYNGRDFRAAQEVRTLTQQLRDSGANVQPSGTRHGDANEFDKGISDGYKKGLSAGLADARDGKAFKPGDSDCPRKRSDQFCGAHRLGYELGYSDGFNNQRKPEESVKTASE